MRREILVTGGAGYIGSHTLIELIDSGYDPVVVDNFSNSSPKVKERIENIIGYMPTFYDIDLLDREGLNDVFLNHKFEGVIHFAGLKAVGESTEIPLKYYKENIMSTINLCELMSDYNVKKIVFSSSATVYGINNNMPVDEEGYLEASNPYGKTKLFIEEILKDLFQADPSWNITLLRYFNPIGAHDSGLIGEDPEGIPNNLMPFITNVATGKLKSLKVFGDNYDTVDGTGVRDYVHVVDLAKGHVKSLESATSSGVHIFNMGTGRGNSVLEVVKAFEEVTKQKIPYEIVDRRPGDVASCYANVTKSNQTLNWYAQKDIFDMCRDAWNWQRSNPNGYDSI